MCAKESTTFRIAHDAAGLQRPLREPIWSSPSKQCHLCSDLGLVGCRISLNMIKYRSGMNQDEPWETAVIG